MTDLGGMNAEELAGQIEDALADGSVVGSEKLFYIQVRVAELARRVDCGGVNCGKCQQCLTVDKHFVLQAVEHCKASLSSAVEVLRYIGDKVGGAVTDEERFALADMANEVVAKVAGE